MQATARVVNGTRDTVLAPEHKKNTAETGDKCKETNENSPSPVTRRNCIKKLLTDFEEQSDQKPWDQEIIAETIEGIIWLAGSNELLLTQIAQEPKFRTVCAKLEAFTGITENKDSAQERSRLRTAFYRLLFVVSSTRSGPSYLSTMDVDFLPNLHAGLKVPCVEGSKDTIIGILCNMTRDHAIGRNMIERGIVDTLINMIKSRTVGNGGEFVGILRILNNIAANKTGAKMLVDKTLTEQCLGIIETLMKGLPETRNDSALQWAFSLMSNLCQIDEGREIFCSKRGSRFTADTLKENKTAELCSEALKNSALRLQKIALGEEIDTFKWKETMQKMGTGCEDDIYATILKGFLIEEIESYKLGMEWQIKMSPMVRQLIFDPRMKNATPKSEKVVLQKGTVWTSQETIDTWTEFSDVYDIHKMGNTYIQPFAAAALNSGLNLRLIFGVSKTDKTIEGVHMETEDRDTFRIGIDAALTKGVRPPIPPYYSIDFFPVSECEEELEPDSVEEFVIQLRIDKDTRNATTQYYQLINGQVFVKDDEGVKQVDAQSFVDEVIKKNMIQEQRESHWLQGVLDALAH